MHRKRGRWRSPRRIRSARSDSFTAGPARADARRRRRRPRPRSALVALRMRRARARPQRRSPRRRPARPRRRARPPRRPRRPGPPAVLLPSGGVEVVAQGLQAPWSILRLPTGGVLVSERDTANVVEVQGDGSLRVAATVPGVVPGGEGGLLGLAFRASDGDRPDYVYAYFTAASDNRIVRMPLTGAPGSLGLGAPEDVLTGIPKAGNHDGGRIAFGPDGFLYATAGDAGNRDAAQDPASLSGKILRMTPDGPPGAGQPVRQPHLVVRAPQSAGDRVGRRGRPVGGGVRAEHVGRAEPHHPGRELRMADRRGPGRRPPIRRPRRRSGRPPRRARAGSRSSATRCSWRPCAASGCGRSLRPPRAARSRRRRGSSASSGGSATSTAGPDGELWFIANNTDGRGSPSAGDDRLYRVRLAPA